MKSSIARDADWKHGRKFVRRTSTVLVIAAAVSISLFPPRAFTESLFYAARALTGFQQTTNPFSANLGVDTNNDGIDDLQVSYDDNFITIRSQGLPNHKTATFPNSKNPNRIQAQSYTFKIPLHPQRANAITGLPMGPIGVALNGVPFYNPYNAEGQVAVDGYSEEWLDSCCGHPDQRGSYHYHKYPVCTKSPFKDKGDQHSPLIGYAFDGFGIYGPYESKGVMAKDLLGESALDECNGHTDSTRGYHYHVSPNRFPYIVGGYRGTPETSNNQMIRVGQGAALTGSATGLSPYDSSILSVSPSVVELGSKQILSIELATVGVPSGLPSRVLFGPYEATNVGRNGNVITAEIMIGADDDTNVYDAAIEFASTGNPTVIRRKNALSVGEGVKSEADFTLHIEDELGAVARGSKVKQEIHIMRSNGFTGTVTISAPDTLPSKIKVSPSFIGTTEMSATFTIKIKSGARTGTQELTFTGRDDSGRTRTVVVTLEVQ